MFGCPNCNIDYDMLYQMYIVDELSCKEIGDELGWHLSTIRNQLDKHKIGVRPSGIWTQRCREEFSKRRMGAGNPMYGKKMPDAQKEALRKFWTGRKCPNKSMPGAKNPAWKGGKWKQNGYVSVRVNGKRILEHRLIAEQALGRKLKPSEMMHHFNGKRNDNRNKNLLVCTKSYHQWLEGKMASLYKAENF